VRDRLHEMTQTFVSQLAESPFVSEQKIRALRDTSGQMFPTPQTLITPRRVLMTVGLC
jgi:hypothetical protein